MPKPKPAKKRSSRPPEMDYLKAIKANMDRFTPAQRLLAEYILHNPESVLFMTIIELAEAARISQATIVRFCNLLGYGGYTQLTKGAQQVIHSQMSTAGRFHLARERRSKTAPDRKQKQDRPAFTRVLDHELENLNRLAEGIRIDDFNRTVRLLARADRVVIAGCMASASLAQHFGYMLSKILPQVDVIRSESPSAYAKVMRLTPKSAAFLLAFPRYPAQTLRLGEQVAASGAKTVVITDSHLSPLSSLGQVVFHIHVGIPGFVDAYAAPLTFINALCTELAEGYSDQAVEGLNRFDRFVDKANLFYKRTHRGRTKNNETPGGMNTEI